MMRLFQTSLLISALIACTLTQAEIYKTTDKHGNVTYSDQADKRAEPVDVRSTNSIPAVKTAARNSSATDDASAVDDTISYRHVRIVAPADDTGIGHGPGNFTVRAQTKPELAKRHALQLYLDGAAYGEANTSGSFALTNIDRGTHKLEVKIIDAAGKALKSSKSIEVHVFRPSVLQPGLRGR